jgi:F-type H+-transporting ATPase subunit alpha
MTDAGHAVHEAAVKIPAEVRLRFETADKLSDEDRQTVIEIARKSLAPFQPKPEAKAEAKPKPETEPKPDGGSKPDAPTDAKPKPKAAVKEKS